MGKEVVHLRPDLANHLEIWQLDIVQITEFAPELSQIPDASASDLDASELLERMR